MPSLASCSTGQSESAEASGPPAGRQSSSHDTGPAVIGDCKGDIGRRSADGDVTVPNGGTCELRGIAVEGNISVGHRARLYVRGVDVDGDIEGEGTSAVEVTDGSRVGGNLQLESGGSAIVERLPRRRRSQL